MTRIELAQQLEQQILGSRWHPLSCGCLLSVVCRMPGAIQYLFFEVAGHKFCDTHSGLPAISRFRKMMSTKTFQGWRTPDPHEPGPVTMDEFQAAFDAYVTSIGYKPESNHPSDTFICSADAEKNWIYRSGVFSDNRDVTYDFGPNHSYAGGP